MRKLLAIIFAAGALIALAAVLDVFISGMITTDYILLHKSDLFGLPIDVTSSIAMIILFFLGVLLSIYFFDTETWYYKIYDLNGQLVGDSRILYPKGYRSRKKAKKAALDILESEMLPLDQHLILIDN